MFNVSLGVTPNDDPAAAAQWVIDFNAALPAQLRPITPVASVTVSPTTTDTVDENTDDSEPLDVEGQLNRLTGYWKTRAPFLQRLHDGMLMLGYEPKVPEQRTAKRQASYLSYVDPDDGRNLLNANSGTVYIMRKDVAEALAGHAFVRDGRQPAVEIDSNEKVDFLLDVAEQRKK